MVKLIVVVASHRCVVTVAQQHVRKTRLEKVHGEERGASDDVLEKQIDRLPVACRVSISFLTQLQQRRRCKSKKFLESFLDASPVNSKEGGSNMVDRPGEGVRVVAMGD